MHPYEQQQAAKKARADHYAQKNESAAESRYDRAHQIGDAIPFGQPILAGHHSQRRHQRDISRIDSNMRKAREHQDKAAYWERKADHAEVMADKFRETQSALGDSFIAALMPGDKVRIRWTNCYRQYEAIAEVVRLNARTIITRITDPLESGYDAGREWPMQKRGTKQNCIMEKVE